MAAFATVQENTGKDLQWPPIGVFWDIENCSVPHGKSALALTQRVRDKFFTGHREVEFMCVCDTSKQNRDVIEELNHGQVTVVHIHATSKNAADDKLRQSLRRFANAYPAPATAVLLSGDVNFASELSDLRYRHRHHVILVHRSNTQDALLNCAHECHLFEDVTNDLPERGSNKSVGGMTELLITGLPLNRPMGSLHYRLRQLSDNCGGRVVDVGKSSALIRFPTVEATLRARKRLEGEDVFGAKIMVDFVLSSGTQKNSSRSAGGGGFRSPKPKHQGVLNMERSHSLSPRPYHRARSAQRPQQAGRPSDSPQGSQAVPGGRGDHRQTQSLLGQAERPQSPVRGPSPQHQRQLYYRKSSSCDSGPAQRKDTGKLMGGYQTFEQPVRDRPVTPKTTNRNNVLSFPQVNSHNASMKKTVKSAPPAAGSTDSSRNIADTAKSDSKSARKTSTDSHILNNSDGAKSSTGGSACQVSNELSLDMKPEREKPCKMNNKNTAQTNNKHKKNTDTNPVKSPGKKRRRRKSHSEKMNKAASKQVNVKPGNATSKTETETEQDGGAVAAPELCSSPDVIIEGEYEITSKQNSGDSLTGPNLAKHDQKYQKYHPATHSDPGTRLSLSPFRRQYKCRGTGARPEHSQIQAVSPHKVHKPRPIRPKFQSPGKYLNGYSNQYHAVPYQYATPPAVRKFNHYRYTTWRDYDGYYSQFGYSQHREDGMESGHVKDVVDKYNHNNQKMSREVLFLQQQIYQEDQWQKAEAEEDLLLQEDVDVFCRDECHSAPPLPFHHSYQSPPERTRHHSMSPRDAHKLRSPNFRRTPGASRPSSRQSHHSGGGSRPGSSLSMKSNSSYGSYGHYSHNSSHQDDNHFQPIRNSSSPLLSISDLAEDRRSEEDSDMSYVELMVSNLDYNISAREWRKILYAEFHQHVQVIGVYIQTQPDNTNIGFIKVPAIDDARFAISQFHRKKIGYKRIHVTLVSQDESSAANAKSDVITLLQEVPSHQLSLYKLMELYEKRFQRPITVSELYSFQDVLEIWELEGQGRVVRLIPSSSEQPATDNIDEVSGDASSFAVCTVHCTEGSSAFQEALESCVVLFVTIQLKSFSAQVHTLIQSHEDCLPLASFSTCYSCEFGPLPTVSHGGVPLEHVISCVPGVKVDVTPSGTKNIQWAENKPSPVLSAEQGRFCASPLLNQQLLQFSREVVELLRYSPQCRLPFNKFIPTYHHTLGKQCRVADYGYTKLLELFDAIPHVVQVIGVGNRKYVTLTHRAQMKRFAMDMLRVLKSQASKQISILDLPIVYNKVMGKPFDITEYGLCYLEDVLTELPENTISVIGSGEDLILSIPRRDQTSEEMEMTKQFALEVVDLLKHTPQCRMPFHRFIPAYHHHFGKQCRVSDYGFTKLVELFEAIPHVLKILDEQEDKVLTLVEPELLKVLEDQVVSLLKSCPDHKLPVPEFLSSYTKFHGHSLRLQDYGVTSVVELIEKLHKVAQVESREGKYIIKLVDHSHVQMLAHRLLLLLMDQVDGAMSLETLQERYKQLFGHTFTEAEVTHDLQGLVQVSDASGKTMVKLCPLQLFARDIRSLLRHHNGKLALGQFEAAYATHFGVQLVPASYGYPSTTALLQAIPHVAQARGKGHHKTVLLCQDFQGKLTTGPPSRIERATSPLVNDTPNHSNSDLMSHTPLRSSPYDFLSGRVPSGVPSPELTPSSVLPSGDLMKFDHTPISVQDFFNGLSPDEKRGQKSPLCKTPVSDMLQFAAQLLPTDSSSQTGSTPAGGSASGHYLHPNDQYHSSGCLHVPEIPSDAPHVAILEQQMENRASVSKDTHPQYGLPSQNCNQQLPYCPGMSDSTTHHQDPYAYGRPTIFNTPSHESTTYQSVKYNGHHGTHSPHNGASTNAEDRKLLSLLQGTATPSGDHAENHTVQLQPATDVNVHTEKEIIQQQSQSEECKTKLMSTSEPTTSPVKRVGGTLFWVKTEAKQLESNPSSGTQGNGAARVSPAGCEDPLPTLTNAGGKDAQLSTPLLLPPSSLAQAPAPSKVQVNPDLEKSSQPGFTTPSALKLVTPASLAQADVPSYKLMTPASLTVPKLAYSAVVAQGSNIHKSETTSCGSTGQAKDFPASPKRSPKSKVAERLHNPRSDMTGSSPARQRPEKGGPLSTDPEGSHNQEPTIPPVSVMPTPTRCVSGASLADDDTNDSSVTSSPSPSRRQGTPRKSRLAAKFTASPSN